MDPSTPNIARIVASHFVMGTDKPLELPKVEIPEIAFIGRTNVGKSTLINRVTNRRSLARSSSTPGRTQEFNLFLAEVKGQTDRQQLMFVDLPGFGYSKFSVTKRVALERATYLYLTKRPSLSLVCLLNDVRRDPKEEELHIFNLARERSIPLILVITKTDKLTSRQLAIREQALINQYGVDTSNICRMGSGVDGSVLVTAALQALRENDSGIR